MIQGKKAFENIVGKGENAFSPFPTMFSMVFPNKIFSNFFIPNKYFVVCKCLQSNILWFGNELTHNPEF